MWRSFLFPTRTVGTLKKNMVQNEQILGVDFNFKEFKGWIELTESCQPCLAACHVELEQLQNWTGDRHYYFKRWSGSMILTMLQHLDTKTSRWIICNLFYSGTQHVIFPILPLDLFRQLQRGMQILYGWFGEMNSRHKISFFSRIFFWWSEHLCTKKLKIEDIF